MNAYSGMFGLGHSFQFGLLITNLEDVIFMP
jgi:hypothetical protein